MALKALSLVPSALHLAEALRREAEANPPPVLSALPPRPRGAFGRLLALLDRLPRPAATLAAIALIGTGALAPDWFAARMEALSRAPEALWWIAGALLSLHCGARLQARAQAHERDLATIAAGAAEPPPEAETPAIAAPGPEPEVALATLSAGPNPALDAWRALRDAN